MALFGSDREKELGLDITDEQLAEMKQNLTNINYKQAGMEERKYKHDVMVHPCSHIRYRMPKSCSHHSSWSYLLLCWGLYRFNLCSEMDLNYLKPKLATCIDLLKKFAFEHKNLPCLSYTHLQAAQVSTVSLLWRSGHAFGLKNFLWI